MVNSHLAVDISDNTNMTMLYKIDSGYVREEHYGLTLARVVDLPPGVLKVAERVSNTLAAHAEAKKKSSKALAVAKRRKLLLNLKETLKQAESSPMEGKALLSWLRKLQDEFCRRMEKIENDMNGEGEESVLDGDEDGDDGIAEEDDERPETVADEDEDMSEV